MSTAQASVSVAQYRGATGGRRAQRSAARAPRPASVIASTRGDPVTKPIARPSTGRASAGPVMVTSDARELFASVVRGPLDERVRDRIIAAARGNPLAPLELPRG